MIYRASLQSERAVPQHCNSWPQLPAKENTQDVWLTTPQQSACETFRKQSLCEILLSLYQTIKTLPRSFFMHLLLLIINWGLNFWSSCSRFILPAPLHWVRTPSCKNTDLGVSLVSSMMQLITGIQTVGLWVSATRSTLTTPCSHRCKAAFNVSWLEAQTVTLHYNTSVCCSRLSSADSCMFAAMSQQHYQALINHC